MPWRLWRAAARPRPAEEPADDGGWDDFAMGDFDSGEDATA